MASPIYFNLYMDELYDIIIKSGLGCKIDDYAYSVLGYADDVTLVSPSVDGLQEMIHIVEDFCNNNGLTISVHTNPEKSKTKCAHFNSKQTPRSMQVYNMEIPWVEEAGHLGHVVNNDESCAQDMRRKRATYISKVHSLRQELGNQDPEVFNKIIFTYGGAFYGAMLWDI